MVIGKDSFCVALLLIVCFVISQPRRQCPPNVGPSPSGLITPRDPGHAIAPHHAVSSGEGVPSAMLPVISQRRAGMFVRMDGISMMPSEG